MWAHGMSTSAMWVMGGLMGLATIGFWVLGAWVARRADPNLPAAFHHSLTAPSRARSS